MIELICKRVLLSAVLFGWLRNYANRLYFERKNARVQCLIGVTAVLLGSGYRVYRAG